MPATVQAKCPRCQKVLRIPADWLEQTMRCKYCRQPVQAKVRSRATPPVAAANPPAPVPAAEAPVMPVFAPLPAVPAAVAPGSLPPVTPVGMPQYAPPQPAFAPAAFPPPAVPAPGPFANAAPPPPPAGPAALAFAGPGVALPGIAGRTRKKSGSGFAILAVAAVGLLVLAGGGALAGVYFFAPGLIGLKPNAAVASKPQDDLPPTSSGLFPRRLLVISVNNYLYANPLGFGADPPDSPSPLKHSVQNFTENLAGQLRVPKEQTYLLSDGLTGPSSRPPLKAIIEQTITRFLDTSRTQDRIVLVFTGHAVEADGEACLVPLEGDLKDKNTLIPIAWLYEKLAACKAQQKILIADVCRYNPARGTERDDGGDMSPKVDETLKNPPAGVQVWASCAAGQRSLEAEDEGIQDGEAKVSMTLRGSVFLNTFFYVTQKGNKAGIARQDKPINLEGHAEIINDWTRRAAKTLRKAEQTPRLAGPTAPTTVPYNPDEPPPPVVKIPTPAEVLGAGQADKAKVRALLAEIDVPPLKIARQGDTPLPLEEILPFPADVLKKYEADYNSLDDIKQDAEKYPLRVAVIEAAELLRKIRTARAGSNGMIQQELPEELRGSATDSVKKDFFNVQKTPARILANLTDSLAALEALEETRDEEKSPRWQANYDFVLAMLKARIAYLHEYNLMLGKVRKDELPELNPDAKQTGWRLSSTPKPASKEAKEFADDVRKLLNKIIKEYPSTPWEVLAKRARLTALGLEWQATSFSE